MMHDEKFREIIEAINDNRYTEAKEIFENLLLEEISKGLIAKKEEVIAEMKLGMKLNESKVNEKMEYDEYNMPIPSIKSKGDCKEILNYLDDDTYIKWWYGKYETDSESIWKKGGKYIQKSYQNSGGWKNVADLSEKEALELLWDSKDAINKNGSIKFYR